MSEGVEYRMGVDELRRELRQAWDDHYALLDALRDLPEIPSSRVLHILSHAAKWPEDHNAGKIIQREVGLNAIPPVSECEGGAGVWQRLRAAAIRAQGE